MSITSANGDVNSKMIITQSGTYLGTGKEVTLKGYYKIEDYAVVNPDQNPGVLIKGANVGGNTDGWVVFEQTYTTGDSNWFGFEFWYATGKMSVAEITMTDADGKVIYDFATDANLPEGDITAPYGTQKGMWYLSYYNVADGSVAYIDPVVSAPVYAPKRVLSVTGVNSEVNAKIAFYSGSMGLTNGAKATMKGYYKVENFKLLSACNAIFVGTNADSRISVTDNTDGWVEFELTFDVGKIIYFEHFYTQGTLSLADLVIEDTEGKKYELATDASLPESDHTGVYDDGKWYTGFYNKADDAIFHFDKAIGNVVPPAPPINAVVTPEIPDLLEQDATGYGPNRAFAIINTKDEMPVANFAVWAEDYFINSSKYYVFAHVKVSGFEAFEGAADAACQIEMLAGENPAQILGSWNANTEGWVALADENGDPFSFGKLTEADSFVLNFSVKNPDVKVEFITADWSNWQEKLMAAYRSGDPIDLIHDGVNNNPRFALNNITQPIDPYVDMTNPNLKMEVMDEIFYYGGKHYVAASEVNVAVMYYNKNLFQQEGLEDPAELYAYVDAAKPKNIAIWKWLCIAAESAPWENIPWVQGNVAIQDQNYWKSNGAKYVFYDQGPSGAYREYELSFPLRWPLWYGANKGCWDQNSTGDQLLKDACQKRYGKGADAMLAYYQALANASKACSADSFAWAAPNPSSVYTPEQVKKIDAAIANAKSMLSKVSELERQRMQNQIDLWEKAKTYF